MKKQYKVKMFNNINEFEEFLNRINFYEIIYIGHSDNYIMFVYTIL